MRCARSIETTTRDSEISLTVLVFGTAYSMPDCRIGAVIMKINRSTSMTSTNGTMFISEREVPVWRASCGIFVFYQLRFARPHNAGKFKRKKELFTQRTLRKLRTQRQPGVVFSSFSSVFSVLKNFSCVFTLFQSLPPPARLYFFDYRCDLQ